MYHSKIRVSFLILGLLASGAAFADATPAFIDESALDRAVSPCDDFYRFACGGWIDRTEIPADQSSWERSFSTIDLQNRQTLRFILETYAGGGTIPSLPNLHNEENAQKLGNYYAACMDEAGVEKSTALELPFELAAIDAVQTQSQLVAKLADLHLKGVGALFAFGSGQDLRDSTRVIGMIDRSGTGLPEPEYYLSSDADKVQLRALYVNHVTAMLILAGASSEEAALGAKTVLTFETALASKSMSEADRRDPEATYHPVNRSGLKALVPFLDWDGYFAALGASGVDQLSVSELEYFATLDALLRKTSQRDLKLYFKWQLIHSFASVLGKSFVQENFNFYGKILGGAKELPPRWKKCVSSTSVALSDALGEVFAALTFGEDGKVKSQAMIQTIRQAFANNLATLDWMDDATRQQAMVKLQAVNEKIGYPDRWKDYGPLAIDRDSYLQNSLRTTRFLAQLDLAKIGKPLDRTQWGMSPQTVNAYYDPSMNEIVFPAGILQSPFYNKDAPLAINYGGIGMVMGHELTHGFDDQGSQFDPFGNLKNWWTPQTGEVFQKKTQCLVDQYSGYTVSGGVHLNGRLTLGENIADLGGMKLAFHAYQLGTQGQPAPAPVDGFSAEQQLFVSFAQSWCAKVSPEQEKLYVATDPHSPPRYRVNGVLVNTPEFAHAFGCSSGTPMAPVNRCSIW